MDNLRQLIHKVLLENIEQEINVYHGSSHDFNKFNHKKHLSSGAGSQSFGWGTYVTDDETIGKSYSTLSDNFTDEGFILTFQGQPIDEAVLYNTVISKIGRWYCKSVLKIDSDNDISDIINRNISNLKRCKFNLETLIKYYNNQIKSYTLLMGTDVNNVNYKFGLDVAKCGLSIANHLQQNKFEAKKDATLPNNYLYDVNIPDNTGTNYFPWYEQPTPQQIEMLYNGFMNLRGNLFKSLLNNLDTSNNDIVTYMAKLRRSAESSSMFRSLQQSYYKRGFQRAVTQMSGQDIYKLLKNHFKSQKAASMFLMQCGFDGIKYPSGTRWKKPDGAKEDEYNYVIFDANKAQIQNKNRLTARGERIPYSKEE